MVDVVLPPSLYVVVVVVVTTVLIAVRRRGGGEAAGETIIGSSVKSTISVRPERVEGAAPEDDGRAEAVESRDAVDMPVRGRAEGAGREGAERACVRVPEEPPGGPLDGEGREPAPPEGAGEDGAEGGGASCRTPRAEPWKEQLEAWSVHLHEAHAPPKKPGICTHWRNGAEPRVFARH